MIFTIIPAVLNLVSIVPLIFYKLDKKTMGEINLRLSEKRKASFEAASGGQNE
ncbi:MAG TPA: hypothetical protein PKH08_02110 [Clostridia bacterium]|nr:hypothetical protein [Clostridia bacterium]